LSNIEQLEDEINQKINELSESFNIQYLLREKLKLSGIKANP